MDKITKLEEDALMEISNMFSFKASMALERISGKPIELKIVSKTIDSFIVHIGKTYDDSTKEPIMYLGIYSALEKGDMEGNIIIVMPKNSALKLYDIIIQNKKFQATKVVDESVKSVLVEFGNIVSGQVLGVLNKSFKIDARYSVPSVISSFGTNIYDYVYLNMPEDYKKAILIKVDTKFKSDGTEIDGQIMLLLSYSSFSTLLKMIDRETNA